MKHILILTSLSFLLSAMPAKAQETAAMWAEKNNDAIAAITDASLAETLAQGNEAWQTLFASVKIGGDSDPLAVTHLAALTQYVMREGTKKQHRAYAEALLKSAQTATDANVTCFFLDQLRWCGLPRQAEAIRRFEQSEAPGVAALANITLKTVKGDGPANATARPANRYAKLNSDLAALKPRRRMPLMLEAFVDPDPAYAGIALKWARDTGGKSETRVWAAKLLTTKSLPHKIMLLDMLGMRGDKTARTEIEAHMQNSDDMIAAAAQRAMVKLGHGEFADSIPMLLQDLPPARQTMTREHLRLLKTTLLVKPLTGQYESFSEPGKRVALEILRERRVRSAVAIGVSALESAEKETIIQGFRLLRETAEPEQAELLAEKLLAVNDQLRPEAQTAFAAAARRDTTSAYTATLLKTLAAAQEKHKPVLLETAGRIGGEQLLAAVDQTAGSTDNESATAAVRALADWTDNASIPALMRHAVSAPDARRQTLAFRGLSKKIEAKDFDKSKYQPVWQQARATPGNEEHKKAIDALLK